MSTLAGKTPKDTFGQLLHVEGGLSNTLRVVEDGTGQTSPFSLSTTACSVPSLRVPYSGSAPASVANAVVLYAHDGTLWQVSDETGPVALEVGAHAAQLASANTAGHVKVGAGLAIDPDGVLSATISGGGGSTPRLVAVTGVSPYTLYDITNEEHETVFLLDYAAAYIFLSLPTVQGNNGLRLVFQVKASGVGCELTAWGTETIGGQSTLDETTLSAGVVLDIVANAAGGRWEMVHLGSGGGIAPHSHSISDVTNLATTLAGKASTTHSHTTFTPDETPLTVAPVATSTLDVVHVWYDTEGNILSRLLMNGTWEIG